MKRRLLIVSFGVVCALAAAALVLFASSRAAPAMASTLLSHFGDSSPKSTTIIARRLISVPFGIQSSLELVNAKEVMVAGHGYYIQSPCWCERKEMV
jgi:hypothetical protein